MATFRRKKRKPTKPAILSEFLPNLFQNRGLSREYSLWQIYSLWNRVVGKNIAKYAQPKKFYRNNLTVVVKTSSWMQELQFMKKEITDRLNREIQNRKEHQKGQLPLELPRIKNMTFLLGNPKPKINFPEILSQKPSFSLKEPTKEERLWLEGKTKGIKDSDWRKTLQDFLLQTQKHPH